MSAMRTSGHLLFKHPRGQAADRRLGAPADAAHMPSPRWHMTATLPATDFDATVWPALISRFAWTLPSRPILVPSALVHRTNSSLNATAFTLPTVTATCHARSFNAYMANQRCIHAVFREYYRQTLQPRSLPRPRLGPLFVGHARARLAVHSGWQSGLSPRLPLRAASKQVL